MRDLVPKMLEDLLRRTGGTAAMTWAMLFLLAVLAGLSCLTIVGRLLAG